MNAIHIDVENDSLAQASFVLPQIYSKQKSSFADCRTNVSKHKDLSFATSTLSQPLRLPSTTFNLTANIRRDFPEVTTA